MRRRLNKNLPHAKRAATSGSCGLRHRRRLLRLGFLLVTLLATKSLPGAPTQILQDWKGELFQQNQGGLFVKVVQRGFNASAQTKFLTGNVQIALVNLLDGKTYALMAEPASEGLPPARPRQLWKAPSGKYEITQITMVDTFGTGRQWTPAGGKRKLVVVRRQCLSNFGLWTLSPDASSGLKVTFASSPNTYKEEGSKKDSSVAAVLDGFSGLIQEALGGKKVLLGVQNDYGKASELRKTVTFSRQIAMFYKLDLFRHNSHARQISAVLQTYEPNFRRCYTDRLGDDGTLRGDVKFTFLLSKQTGTMAKLKNTGGSMPDPKVAECMYLELGQIQFPVPENMVGELTYTYDVK